MSSSVLNVEFVNAINDYNLYPLYLGACVYICVCVFVIYGRPEGRTREVKI